VATSPAVTRITRYITLAIEEKEEEKRMNL
jgi:hypothetical protein